MKKNNQGILRHSLVEAYNILWLEKMTRHVHCTIQTNLEKQFVWLVQWTYFIKRPLEELFFSWFILILKKYVYIDWRWNHRFLTTEKEWKKTRWYDFFKDDWLGWIEPCPQESRWPVVIPQSDSIHLLVSLLIFNIDVVVLFLFLIGVTAEVAHAPIIQSHE